MFTSLELANISLSSSQGTPINPNETHRDWDPSELGNNSPIRGKDHSEPRVLRRSQRTKRLPEKIRKNAKSPPRNKEGRGVHVSELKKLSEEVIVLSPVNGNKCERDWEPVASTPFRATAPPAFIADQGEVDGELLSELQNDCSSLAQLECVSFVLADQENQPDDQVFVEPRTTGPWEKIEGAVWGDMKGSVIVDAVDKVFLSVSKWRQNLFMLPSGKVGEEFIEQLDKCIEYFNNGSAFEPIALTMAAIIWHLLLQKPSRNSKTRDHIKYLEKRLQLWKRGELKELLDEGEAIQRRFSNKKKTKAAKKEKRFTNLMEKGRVSAALKCIGSQESTVLEVTDDVLSTLKEKHPEPQELPENPGNHLFRGPLKKKPVEEVIFEDLDSEAIYKTAKKVHGAAGPSGADADQWRRVLCSKQFKKKTANLCCTISDLAKKLNTQIVEPTFLRAYVASKLVPLDKNPGVRPIGIGQVLRRIVGSATVGLLKSDLAASTAPLQTCAGLRGGIEASIHAMRKIWEDESTEGILLVDASNAFNALNRKAALHNVQYTCPELSRYVQNIYGHEAELFITGSEEILKSKEGTTQGGPESMGNYAASTMSLLTSDTVDSNGNSLIPGLKRVAFADDKNDAGALDELRVIWDDIQRTGPAIGYFPYALKTILIVKPQHFERAKLLFPDITVTTEGHRFLGSYIGTEEGTKKFVMEQLEDWSRDIEDLTKIAESDPQLAYIGYVFGTSQRWKFVCRTTPNIAHLLQPLEDLIQQKLIPVLFGGRTVSHDMRKVASLPARLGGLGLLNPVLEAEHEFDCSQIMTQQLTEAIVNQRSYFQPNQEKQQEAVKLVKDKKLERHKIVTEEIKAVVSEDVFKVILLSAEKGASIWLTTLPLKELGFRLNKQDFVDSLCLRYNLRPKDVPKSCACGSDYSVNHCLTCKKGGYVHIRHDTIRNTMGELLKEVCKDVRVEPSLLCITGEELPSGSNLSDGARSDVSALGFWSPLCRAFFDVRIFNPFSQSNWTNQIPKMYVRHEKEKKREYGPRIREIEKGTFTPLVFNCAGGTAVEATAALKTLGQKLANKRQEPYSVIMSFIRRRLRFDLLRSCVLSLRGERGTKQMEESKEIAELDFSICEFNAGE